MGLENRYYQNVELYKYLQIYSLLEEPATMSSGFHFKKISKWIIEPANSGGGSEFPLLAEIIKKHVFYIINVSNVSTLHGVEGMNL